MCPIISLTMSFSYLFPYKLCHMCAICHPHIHFKIDFHSPIVEAKYENLLFRFLKAWGHPERVDLPAETSEEFLDWKFPQGRFTLISPLKLTLILNRWPYNILASLVSIHCPQDSTPTIVWV